MLDFIILFVLARNVGKKAKDKGHPGWPYVILFVVLWLVCEVGGIVVAAFAVALMDLDESMELGAVLLGAVIGMAAATAVTFTIVGRLPDNSPKPNDFDEERDRFGKPLPWHRDLPADVDAKFGDRLNTPPRPAADDTRKEDRKSEYLQPPRRDDLD